MTQPCDLSASEARRLIGSGELSPVELTLSCLGRIETLNPTLNAMVTLAEDRALEEAALAAKAVVHGESLGLLHGLPIAIKDLQATEGVVTTYGSAFYRDHVPDEDAGIVARIRSAGGIVIGKTNIPEMSIGANTINRLFGATGNPYAPALTCGGSSGGSAVAVATGMAPLATGSDHGGSLRIPACFSGVVGHRATPGTVPYEGRTITQTNYSLQGPIARNVEDVGLLLATIAHRDRNSRRDPMTFPLDVDAFLEPSQVDVSSLKIGVTADFGGLLVSDHVRSEFRQRVELLEKAGAEVTHLSLDLCDAVDVDWQLRADVFATQYHRQIEHFDDTFNPNVFRTYETALSTTVLEIAKARRRQIELFRAVDAVFDDVDLFICPGVSVPPFPWSSLHPTEIDGQPVDNYMAWLGLTACLTVVGHPVVALPAGLDALQLPFGIQCVGPMYQDAALLRMTRGIEDCFGGFEVTQTPSPDIAAIVATDPKCQELGRAAAIAAAT
ncbi:MAG TPA: amidase [Acidimicrobiia bacterium]|nr:amidase [Acidimicrobiia bacterium]HIL06327.1 amidase [Acidimicrobiia bacterium]